MELGVGRLRRVENIKYINAQYFFLNSPIFIRMGDKQALRELFEAATNGDILKVRQLFDQGTDLNSVDDVRNLIWVDFSFFT